MKTIKELQDISHQNSVNKGFWDKQMYYCETNVLDLELVKASIPEKLALIHSEASEALEDYRSNNMVTITEVPVGKPVGFPSELADIVIRVMDLCGALGIDLQEEIELKQAYNATRSKMHGGKKC